jgi:hypothetical protein
MISTDIINELRFAVDALAAVGSEIGLHRTKVFLVKRFVTSNGRDRPVVNSSEETRIVIGTTPFSSIYPGDGYLNPSVRYVSGKEVALSGNRLTSKCLVMNLRYPYTVNGESGGTSEKIFDPDLFTKNMQIYVRLIGAGFEEGDGSLCKVLYTDQNNTLSYKVYMQTTGSIL